ncbi:glycoside hydrolase family 3 protein [Sulfurovum sp. NBC37-1]|uniref:glycoside hydrolase family 3 protein n=1 Tax=Sulfurovum sp. (strain NBC37-1) TaxID=387093 RepID=UPI00015878E8|nr:glycoside hydrolase family 3 N-terminal domain-containing protein [Sulfurovum sp. NBC37-1]BAF71407.1 glycosyl hydrolase, family 3 [Sulfurovum sp. NBC37-1]
MKKIFLMVAVMAVTSLWAGVSLDQKIGQMLMVGFHGTSAPKNSRICQDIRKYHIGAVILFDYNPVDKSKPKNIASRKQLKKLTAQLQKCSYDGKLLIAVDQEGGKVQRLKRKYGFYGNFPKASDVTRMDKKQIKKTYRKMAKELKSVGINYDLAPVVDLDINPKNHVIHGLGRSFGKDPKTVAAYASTFIDAMHHYGVLTSLKHFPGHGSSVGDTHKGFVDVTNLWKRVELEPYRLLNRKADTVMVAHVFNKKLDARYPASFSNRTVNGILRKQLGFNGVVITDDLQMGAISKKYGLKNTLKLAINAGDDILLFGNQLDPRKTVSTKKLVETIKSLLKRGEVNPKSIDYAYIRIQNLKRKL